MRLVSGLVRQRLDEDVIALRHGIDDDFCRYGPGRAEIKLRDESRQHHGLGFLQLKRGIVGLAAQYAGAADEQDLHAGAPMGYRGGQYIEIATDTLYALAGLYML